MRVAVTAEVAAARRRLAEAGSAAETARARVAVLAAVLRQPAKARVAVLAAARRQPAKAAIETDLGARFDPVVRVVTMAALAHCVAAPAVVAARRLTVETANDAAEAGAPVVAAVAVAAAALPG